MQASVGTDSNARRSGPDIQGTVGLSLLITLVFFAVCLGLLRPGYAINDDIKIIAMAAGYPGVPGSPFLIFSNVLLGFLLVALYRLPSAINWEIALFLIVDAVCVWTLLYIVFASTRSRGPRILSAALILACASYYPLRITFTSTAGLACEVGLIAILAGAFRGRESRTVMVVGAGLTFIGSLIRLEMLPIAAPGALVFAVAIRRDIGWRTACLGLAGAGTLVLAAFGADALYVRAHAEWHAFYKYIKATQAVQDSHRLENVHTEIRRIGWSKNDQEVFARYFYPDAEIYSLEHLQFLVDRVPGYSQNAAYVLDSFTRRLIDGRAALALLVCISSWILLLGIRAPRMALWTVPLVAASSLAANLGLMWLYKSPDYVFLSTLSHAALLCAVFPCFYMGPRFGNGTSKGWQRAAFIAALFTFAVALGVGIWQSIRESKENSANEAAYAQIVDDMERLRQDGTIANDAIVISASHGIPWHWANPLRTEFPSFTYLDTGWITFSPFYQQILTAYGLDPMTKSIVTSQRVYWASKPIFQVFLARYLEEHEGKLVGFETLYRLPDVNQPHGERGIELYRVVP